MHYYTEFDSIYKSLNKITYLTHYIRFHISMKQIPIQFVHHQPLRYRVWSGLNSFDAVGRKRFPKLYQTIYPNASSRHHLKRKKKIIVKPTIIYRATHPPLPIHFNHFGDCIVIQHRARKRKTSRNELNMQM